MYKHQHKKCLKNASKYIHLGWYGYFTPNNIIIELIYYRQDNFWPNVSSLGPKMLVKIVIFIVSVLKVLTNLEQVYIYGTRQGYVTKSGINIELIDHPYHTNGKIHTFSNFLSILSAQTIKITILTPILGPKKDTFGQKFSW